MAERRLLKSETVDILLSVLLQEMDPDNVDGVDIRLLQKFSPLFDAAARFYLRMEVEGMDGVPAGKALLVGNHNAGITFIEPMGLGARWYIERGTDDLIQWLVHDAMLAMPGLRTFLVRTGCVRASHANADEVLERGRKVAVFPGGNLEAFRPYRKRHQVVFGGRKGFIRLALRNQVPIVPFVIVGGHESFVILHDGRELARRLHLKQLVRSDTCPLFLGLPWGVGLGPIFHLHLPTKSQVRFLDPIDISGYGPEDQDDSELLDELYRRVTDSMQAAMQDIGTGRRFPVLG
jgi:1-acyl-sn-glycerol-3-phosphate acyltransferase